MDRGQIHTLEAIVAAFLLLSSVVFALQITAVTPLSASTSSQHIENQLQGSIQGMLSGAAAEDELEPALLAWDPDPGEFHGTSGQSYYTSSAPPNDFGDRLRRAFDRRGVAYNIYIHYFTDGARRVDRFVYRGAPSDNAVRGTWTVVLTDDDRLYDASMNETATRVDESNYFAPDMSSESGTYNVLRVEVVAWRI